MLAAPARSTGDRPSIRRWLAAHFEIPSAGHRLVPMEGMRGFAALLVFFVHFDSLYRGYFRPGSRTLSLADFAGHCGHAGVDLFFVLSGFLVYGIVLQGKSTYARYVARRAQRLYPVFLVMLGLYLALSLAFPANSKLPASLSRNVLYIAANLAMLPGILRIEPIIAVAWSLSYEWFFYLLIPLIVMGLGLRRWRSSRRILLFLSLAAAQYAISMAGLWNHPRLILFVSGIVLWELVNHHSVPSYCKSWGEYAAILLFAGNLAVIGLVSHYDADAVFSRAHVPRFYAISLFVTAFLLTLYALFFDGLLKRFFSWDYLRWMGNTSYSYYLTHGLTLKGVRMLLGKLVPPAPHSAAFGLALLAVCIVATVFAGALLFLWIEKPWSLLPGKAEPPSASR